ncbi:MAG: sugar ABC transporter permease [Clostridiaceae bacterium]|jgi:multiple sugar transport system permease protein|nr:sugar ABC transporter permease [Clostridiaceae bacterium]
MKNISKIVESKTAYILILPAVVFILLFSIIPIGESLRYAFFDFQLNDQAKSGLYINANYNIALYDETAFYIRSFLDMEEEVVTKDETKLQIDAIRNMLDEYDQYMLNNISSPDMASVVSVNNEKLAYVTKIRDNIMSSLEKLYSFDEPFVCEEDMFAVASELDTAIISSNFSGLNNFKSVLTDTRVHSTVGFTLIFTFISVFFELCFGMALALIMNKALKGRGIIRTVSLIPWAIPTAVAALIWSYLYNGSSGIISHLFAWLKIIPEPTELLLSSTGSLWAIILADVWKTTPYMALLLLAGLQTIPHSLYESSSLDGATKLQQFGSVTLPLLKPSIFVALLFRTLDAFRVFDLIYVLTGGGPGGTTESVSIYAYKVMFAQTRFGYGSAVVLVMALTVGLITFAYIKLLNVKLIND